MADVTVTCSGCGAKVVASEFADSVTCRSCGKTTPAVAAAVHQAKDGSAGPAGLKLKDGQSHGTSIRPPSDIEEVVRRVKARSENRNKVGSEWANHPLIAWGVFLIIGCLCAWARFGTLLPPEYLERLKVWGPAAALFFHAVVVIKAFEDSIFYGSLCLLLPPYTFYYLFALCDNFVLRALYMGVLAGVGMDTFFLLKWLSVEVYIKVTSWIIYGG